MTDPLYAELMRPGVDAYDALARLLEHRPAWHRRAACRGHDPALFFPERGGTGTEARALCAGCPVRARCELAARAGAEVGIWGGTSARERKRTRREAAA